MKKGALILGLVLTFASVLSSSAYAVWVWTPETGKWINPKYSAEQTPQAQFEYAQALYEKGDYAGAVREHKKLLKRYGDSPYVSKSQFALGRIYEKMGKLYPAFKEHEKLLDKYPESEEVGEVLSSLYEIGNSFFS